MLQVAKSLLLKVSDLEMEQSGQQLKVLNVKSSLKVLMNSHAEQELPLKHPKWQELLLSLQKKLAEGDDLTQMILPAMTKPQMIKPAMTKPVTIKPAMTKPQMIKQATIKPAMIKPATIKPAMIKPATIKLAMTKLLQTINLLQTIKPQETTKPQMMTNPQEKHQLQKKKHQLQSQR
jgi:hypothetical protein